MKCFTSSHHQQVTAGHTDDADVREGLEDVLQGGGGEGQDLLGGVLCNTLQHRLDGQTEREREVSSVKSETEKNRQQVEEDWTTTCRTHLSGPARVTRLFSSLGATGGSFDAVVRF